MCKFWQKHALKVKLWKFCEPPIWELQIEPHTRTALQLPAKHKQIYSNFIESTYHILWCQILGRLKSKAIITSVNHNSSHFSRKWGRCKLSLVYFLHTHTGWAISNNVNTYLSHPVCSSYAMPYSSFESIHPYGRHNFWIFA